MTNRKKSKMNKKQILLTLVTSLLIVAVASGIIFAGVSAMRLNKYKDMKVTLPQGFTITAHTGCMGTKENSVESMQKGVDNGAKIIEFDVHFTDDGVPVLSHDKPKGDELSLNEAFDFLARNEFVKANVDMKSVDNMTAVRKAAMKKGVMSQIFFTGINAEFVEAVKINCNDIEYYLNVDVDKKKNTDPEYLESLVTQVKEAGAMGINFNYKSASKEIVDYFHENDLLVSIWTVDKKIDMYKVLEMAPDNITTRNPDKLSEIIKNME